ncbi:type II toxin-antitoxin system PemK/MazF family toxin [Peteryoungia desertarenae]|uniref:Type II toxin-antitoxin system PemK/MazF family toxin n=1 Tax=Peteryoungia desertarenae TaxID=1813451 RepID=A0ABX6QMA9_9HYPH|nr:type II toxin-antitoxin system PemK/MazF family toxin [Peteryoungia desertarenae]QLF69674.1 type II toxin-antitoxin system PemK/MazF family toxin [Peteryoungia desertarenae]
MVRPNIPAPGEIWWIDLQPASGKEQRGRHAGVILSAYKFNMATGLAFIAPVTTVGKASRLTGFAVPLSAAGTAITGVIQVDQVKSLDWRNRMAQKTTDRVPDDIMTEILERFAPIFGLVFAATDDE